MKKSKTRFAVLGILSYGPMSGYDIKKFYEKNVAGFWSESYGQIYPILKRLAEEGLATRSDSDPATLQKCIEVFCRETGATRSEITDVET